MKKLAKAGELKLVFHEDMKEYRYALP